MPEIPKFDLSKLVLDNLVVEPDKKVFRGCNEDCTRK